MPTDRAAIFLVTERPDIEARPMNGIYLTDHWHGQGLHRRAIRELTGTLVRPLWLDGPNLIRVLVHRLLVGLANQNEPHGHELSTTLGETDHPVLVIDFTSGDVRLMKADDAESQMAKPLASQPFAKASLLNCGNPDEGE